jgi:UDP-glucose 4-epimerase
MRALVTGGAGFIGSHLAETLLERGHEVAVLDDLSTGSAENIRHLLDRLGFRFIRDSILDAAPLEHAVQWCDHVYHLGAAVGVKLIFDQPVRTIETNVKGTEMVLEAAQRHSRRVFISSTSEVYGKDVREDGGRFREADDITLGTSLRWCYACSKAIDEYLARAYHLEQGLPVVIGRFFNTVGPRQSDAYGMVVPRFVRQALTGRQITVYGDGLQVRSFGWVGDAVQAAVALMEIPKAVGEIYNIGSDEPVTIRELAERVRRITESKSEIVFVPYEEAYGAGFEDIRYRVPDISKIRAAIGYSPTKTLDEIIVKVTEYVRGPARERGAAHGR